MKAVLKAVLVLALFASPLHADERHHQFSEGEVRKIDKEAKKITIKHGALANLDMPAMTMVFQVRDPALLDKVKAGDKVKFQAENIAGAYVVTKLEPAK
jgi:Cu(I)/Ag(I) efflux system periplasmic protein CusF